MTSLKIIPILLITLISCAINAQEFDLQTKESQVSWTGKAAFNAYSLTGSLKTKSGLITIEDNNITELKIIVNMKSLDHDNNDLKRHLRSVDFFEVNTYSEAQFTLKSSTPIVEGKAHITGDLNLKNSTNMEAFDIEITVRQTTVDIQFNKDLDRTKYDIKHNSPSFFKNMKENAIADKFKLEATLRFVKN